MNVPAGLQILCGDALEQLRMLPSESGHCCVTSPPYWGLRDYGCSGQIGLEKTPTEFIERLVHVFREVRRVLRKDGTLWVNMGDWYATGAGSGRSMGGECFGKQNAVIAAGGFQACQANRMPLPGLKPKDLVGIPWMLAFALRADGWWLRQDIIWAKPNPMPESTRDRCTKSHEYLFLLTKSARYFYDAEAIAEPISETSIQRLSQDVDNQTGSDRVPGKTNGAMKAVGRGGKNAMRGQGSNRESETGPANREGRDMRDVGVGATRNKRSVWTVTTKGYSEAHFATFPPALIIPCILAGTSAKGACAECGAPWQRITEGGEPDMAHRKACGSNGDGEYHGKATKDFTAAGAQNASETKARILAGMCERKTVGWEKTCRCGTDEVVPCVVLDPFGGSGTTGRVALDHGRSAILIELNPDYIGLIEKRTTNLTPGLAL